MRLYKSIIDSDNRVIEMDESDEEKIAEIKRRIEDDFYDDPNCLAELAERIIKKMGLEQEE